MSKLLVATNMCQQNGSKVKLNETNVTNFQHHENILEENYLFKNSRYQYLSKIPPFDMFCAAEENADLSKKQSIYSSLVKLEAMLCSNMLPTAAVQEVDIFLKNHPHFVGKIRLQSIILPLSESISILVDRYPMALKLFTQVSKYHHDLRAKKSNDPARA